MKNKNSYVQENQHDCLPLAYHLHPNCFDIVAMVLKESYLVSNLSISECYNVGQFLY